MEPYLYASYDKLQMMKPKLVNRGRLMNVPYLWNRVSSQLQSKSTAPIAGQSVFVSSCSANYAKRLLPPSLVEEQLTNKARNQQINHRPAAPETPAFNEVNRPYQSRGSSGGTFDLPSEKSNFRLTDA